MLTNLESLDLASNSLHTLPSSVFEYNSELTSMYAHTHTHTNNRAQSVTAAGLNKSSDERQSFQVVFGEMVVLTVVYFACLSVIWVAWIHLAGLQSASYRDLSSNSLTTLPKGVLSSLSQLTFLVSNGVARALVNSIYWCSCCALRRN